MCYIKSSNYQLKYIYTMKISESVVTAIITILGVSPFIWFTYLGKKASGKSKKTIKDMLKKENLSFNQKEFWNHNFIGIDEVKNHLVFVKIESPENKMVNIDLSEVKTCHIHKNTKDFKREKKMESELQTLDLELIFASQQPNIILNFYDIEDRLSEDFEMKRAEKWKQFITDGIQKNTAKNTAA